MLIIKNLNKTYKSKSGVIVKALDDISLTLPKKGMVFILGKSGSGKSTLLNVLGGLDSFDSGKFFIKGESTLGFKQSHFDSYRNTYIGFIFQDYNILDEFTVGANIALAMELQGKKANNEKINEILEEVDLLGLGNRKPNELSGGQKQRVAIARALIKDPKIIMADEPTGALDSATGKAVFDTLKKLSNDRLVLIVSHDRDFAEGYADRIIELKDGRIISDVSKEIKENKIENIEFDNNAILVKKGYQLTNEDLLKINEYLLNLKQNSSIELNSKKKVNYVFRDSDVNNIDVDNGGFKLIKSSLSMKNSFKIGRSSLKHKVFRLIVTIFLSIQAFSLFGIADTIAAYSKRNTLVNSIIDSNVTYSTLKKYRYDKENEYDTSFNITDEDLEYINENLSSYYKGVYDPNDYLEVPNISQKEELKEDEEYYYKQLYSYFVPSNFSGFIELSNEELIKYNYSLLAGKIPTNNDECMISDYLYQMYNKFGYTNDGKVESINSPNDLIGKKIDTGLYEFEICGIVNTNFAFDRYESLLKEKSESDMAETIADVILASELSYAQNYSLACTLFVNEGYINDLILKTKTSFYRIDAGWIDVNNDDNSTNIRYVSKNADCSGKVYYFFEKSKVDENNIVVSLNVLTELLNDYSVFNKEKGKELEKIIEIDGVSYSSFDICDATLNDDASFVTDYIYQNLVVKYALDIYKENKEMDLHTIYNELCQILIGNENSIFFNQKEALEEYIVKNYLIDYEKYNGKFESTINFIYCSFSNGYVYKQLENVNIIGVCYDFNLLNSNAAIVSDEIYESLTSEDKGIYAFALSSMPNNKSKIGDVVDFSLENHNEDENYYYNFILQNSVSYELELLDEVLLVLRKVFFYIGLFFALFATILLANFISTSINYKKKDIGILRAIGSRSLDVFKIFFAESFIIAMINFVLSTIITLCLTILINYIIRDSANILVSILTFSIRQVGLILLISLFIAAIATFLPVSRIARKRPIAAIRNN